MLLEAKIDHNYAPLFLLSLLIIRPENCPARIFYPCLELLGIMFYKSVAETQIQIQIDGPKNYIECDVKRGTIISQKYSFPFHHAAVTYNLTHIIHHCFHSILVVWFEYCLDCLTLGTSLYYTILGMNCTMMICSKSACRSERMLLSYFSLEEVLAIIKLSRAYLGTGWKK